MKDLFGNQEIRALSWKEPFATLMLYGKIETRKWKTDYRGLVLICASKVPYNSSELQTIVGWGKWGFATISQINALSNQEFTQTLGNAIAIGELIDCRLMTEDDRNSCFVEYNSDLYCHIYKDVKSIKPIPFKGKQGWTKLSQDFANNIELLNQKQG